MSARVQVGWEWGVPIVIIISVSATLFLPGLYPRGLFPKGLFA